MLYKPQQIVTEISSFMRLNDGDIIMTGTPKGVGQVNQGDHFDAAVLLAGKIIINAQWDAV